MTTTERWLHAIKPSSWPKLLVPMTFGQTLGIVATGELELAAVGLGALFTVCIGLFIVLLNDWGDQKVDRIKREMFPEGCSPKTIPDGVLTARQVFTVGAAAGLVALLIGWLGQAYGEREHLLVASAACLLTFVAYSLPPLKLNYRGGGELLEMAGVGLLLPWWHAYLQSGEVWFTAWVLVVGFCAFSLASALASGLSDEVSDRAGGKRTFTTMLGNAAVRRGVEGAMLVGCILWLLAPRQSDFVPWWTVAPALVVVLTYTWQARRIGSEATTNAFAAQKRYKLYLHQAIWYGTMALSAMLLLALWL
jgi:4-hydroxybenzoate polyprenyltransferase